LGGKVVDEVDAKEDVTIDNDAKSNISDLLNDSAELFTIATPEATAVPCCHEQCARAGMAKEWCTILEK
jgi:hypothetical protein